MEGDSVCWILSKPAHEPSCPPSHLLLLEKGFPLAPSHPTRTPRAAIPGCCLPPAPGMQGYNSGSAGQCCLHFPNASSICGPERLEQPLDLLSHQAERGSSHLGQWDERQGGHVPSSLARQEVLLLWQASAIGKRGTRRLPGAVAPVPEARALRCLWLFASLTFCSV